MLAPEVEALGGPGLLVVPWDATGELGWSDGVRRVLGSWGAGLDEEDSPGGSEAGGSGVGWVGAKRLWGCWSL